MGSVVLLFLFAALALFLLGCKEGIILLKKEIGYAKPRAESLMYCINDYRDLSNLWNCTECIR